MSISHKKMREIKEILPTIISNPEETNKVYEFIKDFFKYNEKNGSYKKDKYEIYTKPYYEKNKERINKASVERRRKKKAEQKNLVEDTKNIEISLNNLSVK